MTVAELIAELQKYPQGSEIVMYRADRDDCWWLRPDWLTKNEIFIDDEYGEPEIVTRALARGEALPPVTFQALVIGYGKEDE